MLITSLFDHLLNKLLAQLRTDCVNQKSQALGSGDLDSRTRRLYAEPKTGLEGALSFSFFLISLLWGSNFTSSAFISFSHLKNK